MAIWQSFLPQFWPQFWYQSTMPKAPSAPMMSKAPMMSEMFPWFEEEDINKLNNMTAGIKDPTEYVRTQNEIYRAVLPQVTNDKIVKERDLMKNRKVYEVTQEKDPVVKKQKEWFLKVTELADIVKNKFNLPANADDKQIMTEFIQQTPNGWKLLEDYLNWGKELLYVSGIEERPVVKIPIEDEWWMSTIGKITATAWAIWLWLWWLKLWGMTIAGLGKKIYWLTLNPTQQEAEAIQSYRAWTSNIKPKTSIETALEQPLLQKWWRTISSKIWMMGTRSMIWEQAASAAKSKFTNIINPIMDNAEKMWLKFDYKKLFDRAKENITKSISYSVTQKKQIIENIDELFEWYNWTTTLKNLDLEKQAIAGKIPQKYQTMLKLPNELKAAQKEIAGIFRSTVHTTIKTVFWIDSAKIYQDYANLKWLSKIWPKALTAGGRKWGAWTLLSWAAEEIATPITTVVWKLSYKVGRVMEMLPDIAVKWIKLLPKTLQKLKWSASWAEFVDKNMINEMVHQSHIWILQWAIKNWWKSWIYKEIYKELWWKEQVQKEIEKLKNNAPKKVKTALIDYLRE